MLKRHWTQGNTEQITLRNGKVQLHIHKSGRHEEFSLHYADSSYAITRSQETYPREALRCDLRRQRFADVAAALGRVIPELCMRYGGKDGFQRPLVVEPVPYTTLASLLAEAEPYLCAKSQARRTALLDRCHTYMNPELVELLSVRVERTPFPKYEHIADVLMEWVGPQCYEPRRRAQIIEIERRILKPGGTLIIPRIGIRRAA